MGKQIDVEILQPGKGPEINKFAVTTTVPGFVSCVEIISQLRAKYSGKKYDVSTVAGMEEATKARRELREARIALDKKKPSASALPHWTRPSGNTRSANVRGVRGLNHERPF